jgi:ribose transport system substrate-binding protein
MKKFKTNKLTTLLLTAAVIVSSTLLGCSSNSGTSSTSGQAGTGKSGGTKEIAVMVPSADHGWTGAVLTYAQDKAKQLNADASVNTKYSVKVYAAKDVENQIQQVDDLLASPANLAGIVILPYDNGLQATLEKIAAAKVPFVQFDRVISSAAIDGKVVANVKGDNKGIGYETAKRFIKNGLSKNDYVYEMIGDNSSVPELRSNGFRAYLKEQGWTDAEINAVVVKSPATGWSRDKGKELFESWFSSSQCDTSKKSWIYTHDDEIGIGILESLNGSALDATKKTAFLGQLKALSASSGLAEMYAVLKDSHQTIKRPTNYDLFSVTYDPGMIQEAVKVMVDYLGGATNIKQDYVIPVSVVDSANVKDFHAFGTYAEKK